MLVFAATLLAAYGAFTPGWLEVTGPRITALGAGEPPRRPDVALTEHVVAPGFVDLHVHGGAGAEYHTTDLDAARHAVEFHRRHGTTSSLASLVTASPERLAAAVSALAELVADGVLAGVHLEGPWLNPERGGAHERRFLRDPDPAELDALLGTGVVRMVTLAPERPGGLDAIRRIVDAGALAAIGHTDADYELTRSAIAAGARVGTHLFNAMRPMHHREPGPTLALLEDPRVTVELIPDGVHLHPALVRHVVAAAGAARTALVTDAMAAAGMPDGSYQLGPLAVTVAGGVARLAGDGPIAGSTATMDQLFRNAVAYLDLPRLDALAAAARMTATTPATTLGLADVGSLRPGHRADLVVLGAEELDVVAVLAAGDWVTPPLART